MNTFTYLMIAFLTLITFPYAVIAFRMIRRDAIVAYRVYKWTTWSHDDEEWSYSGMAKAMRGLSFTWPMLSLVPRFSLPGEKEALEFVEEAEFDKRNQYAHRDEKWRVGKEDYLIVRHRFAWGQTWTIFLLALLFVVLIGGGLWFNTHPVAAEVPTTPEPTQIAVQTSAPLPTPMPEPEVEIVDGGDSIVIDLDQQAVGDALLEWLNDHAKGVSIPTLSGPLADWLNGLPWPEVAAFEMPEDMDGFVVVARKGDGFELVRLEESGNLIGGPVALTDTKEFTLHARELKWGVRYSDKFRVTNESQGHIDVYVAESGEPTMATGYHLYNFRWLHAAIAVIVLIIAGIVVYRRLKY